MKTELKRISRSYAALYGGALMIAVVAFAALKIMGRLGILEYSYRVAASPNALDGTLFDKLCVVLTGSTFVGFLFVSGLVLSLATAAVFLYAHKAASFEAAGGTQAGIALVVGLATAIVSVIVGGLSAFGLFSGVQISLVAGSSMGGGNLGGIVAALLLVVATLIAAACSVARLCVRGTHHGRLSCKRRFAWAAGCTMLVAVLTTGTFGAMNTLPANDVVILVWLVVAGAVNLAILWAAERSAVA